MHLVCVQGQHTRLLTESDPGVEIPLAHTGGQADWTLLSCALSGENAQMICALILISILYIDIWLFTPK